MERPAKRQRTSDDALLPTPPASDCDIPSSAKLLDRATRVLSIQAAALSNISNLYQTRQSARESLRDAVDAIVETQSRRSKLVVCGVGKSAYIGMKFVATCKSLGISSSFMHACEAAHGDLGDVREDDVLLFISYSGKTPELLNLLPHIPLSTRVLALTSRISREDCPLVAGRVDGILLPAPVHALEDDSFGVSAPTTSTTVALAVTDMLALTVADQLHGDTTKQVFKRNHPGGAIGMTHREVEALKEDGINISVLELPSPTISTMDSDGSSRAIP